MLIGLNEGTYDLHPGNQWFCEVAGAKLSQLLQCAKNKGSFDIHRMRFDNNVSVSQAERVLLDVPQRVQETNYWCVPASLQMFLAYKGIDVAQTTLARFQLNTHWPRK